MNRLGEKLRTLRTQYGLTIRELASELGITYGYITQIELDKRTPSAKVILKIADFFEVSADQLMRDDLEVE